MNDFRKYATKHLGMNGMVLDDVMNAQAKYLNPYILEERQLNVTQMDVFSRLMMEDTSPRFSISSFRSAM